MPTTGSVLLRSKGEGRGFLQAAQAFLSSPCNARTSFAGFALSGVFIFFFCVEIQKCRSRFVSAFHFFISFSFQVPEGKHHEMRLKGPGGEETILERRHRSSLSPRELEFPSYAPSNFKVQPGNKSWVRLPFPWGIGQPPVLL